MNVTLKWGGSMLNKFDKPANLRTRENRKATMQNPLDGLPEYPTIQDSCFAELAKVLEVFRECDKGEHRGPFAINSPVHFTICFESNEQREAFRAALHLKNHGEQYWDGAAFLGSLDLLKKGKSTNTFSARENPFAKQIAKKTTENAEKYSILRAEVKKTVEKMKMFTDDGTWIAVCFDTKKSLQDACKKLGIPNDKFIHIDDMLTAIQKTQKIVLPVPHVQFALRAEPRPDKALNALVG